MSADRFEAEDLENAYRMMTTDGLTQTHNKRYLFEVAEREASPRGRSDRPLSLLMIDIDHFKSINDSLGHLAGDEVLIELARRLRLSLRGGEVLARYGGEEFCLLLPDASLAEARAVGERLRALVAARRFSTEHAEVAVTISIGAACAGASRAISVNELIAQADRQLYAAKPRGEIEWWAKRRRRIIRGHPSDASHFLRRVHHVSMDSSGGTGNCRCCAATRGLSIRSREDDLLAAFSDHNGPTTRQRRWKASHRNHPSTERFVSRHPDKRLFAVP